MATSPKRPTALEREQTRKFAREADAAEIHAKRIELEVRDMEHEQTLRQASEWENQIFVFDSVVNASSVQEAMRVLGLWVRRDPAKDITISFNSPGGGVFEGLALYDFIQQLRKRGTRVDTTAIGKAMSMGGVLLQAGETRRMSEHSYLMIHEISTAAIGKMSEMEDEMKFANKLQKRLLYILAERSTMSMTEIKRKWKKNDWYLSAEEALQLGFCDEVE